LRLDGAIVISKKPGQDYRMPLRQRVTPPHLHWLLTCGIVTLALSITSIMGCIGGSWYYRANLEPADQWKSLGSPPEKIEKLLDAEFHTVYVTTLENRIYSCYRGSQYDVECWVEVTQVPEIYRQPCNNTPVSLAPSPPGRVVDSLQVTYCHRFGRTGFDYVLLEDGNVM